MKVLACQLTKGATNCVVGDTLGLRTSASDYAASVEHATVYCGSTNPLTSLRSGLGTTLPKSHGSFAILGTASTANPLLVVYLDDWMAHSNIFIRRNGAVVAASVLVVSVLPLLLDIAGRVYLPSEFDQIGTSAVHAGVEAGIAFARANT